MAGDPARDPELAGLVDLVREVEPGGRVLVVVTLRHQVGSDRVQLLAWGAMPEAGILEDLARFATGRPRARQRGGGVRGAEAWWAGPEVWIRGGAAWDLEDPSPFPEITRREPRMLVRDLGDALKIFARWMGVLARLRADVEVTFFGHGVTLCLAWMDLWVGRLFPNDCRGV